MGIAERKNREKAMRREQIMNAASELFMSRGFGSTTMEEIAKSAELSPALIYQYFKNKEDLYASLTVSSLYRLYEAMQAVNSNNRLSPEAKLMKIKDVWYKHYKSNQLLIRNILHIQLEDTLPNISKEVLHKMNEAGKKTQGVIADIFRQGVEQARFKKRHPIAVSDMIWAAFTGLVVWEDAKRKISPDKDFFKSTLDMVFEVLCKGFK